MRLAIILLLLLALAFPASAAADWRLDRATAIAEYVFPPLCHVATEWKPMNLPIMAVFVTPRCTITYNSNWKFGWEDFCSTTLHEYGHAAGLEHSDNPNSIMYPERIFTDPRCRDRGRRYYSLALQNRVW